MSDTDIDRLEIALRHAALLSESVAYVGFRGFGSGGWFAGCRFEGETIEVDASSPVEAADDLTRMVRNRAEKAASQAELQARQLRARLGEET